MKTNAMRILDKQNIAYEVKEYEPNPRLTGGQIANLLNEDPNSVFKTLVTKAPTREIFVFLVPVNNELNLKKAAKLVNVKSLEMIPVKDLLNTTGYVHGGCSPIGMKKEYATSIDEEILNHDIIHLSGGKVGVQIVLKVDDFLNFVNPKIGEII